MTWSHDITLVFPAPQVIVGLKADGYRLTTAITLAEPLEFAFIADRGGAFPYNRLLRIPAGFVSDGASVPRMFWRLLSPPIDPVTLAPSIAHDWLYIHGSGLGFTRKECDRWYDFALQANGYPLWKCELTYAGIRLGGWSHWNKMQS